jgi:hypothetical protein
MQVEAWLRMLHLFWLEMMSWNRLFWGGGE